MNRPPLPSDDSWESDAIWKLLDQAAPPVPSRGFVNDTVRSARFMEQDEPFWKKWFLPASIGGLAMAATAVVAFVLTISPSPHAPALQTAAAEVKSAENYAALQDEAETETLIVAADHLDDFSDTELVSLIGF